MTDGSSRWLSQHDRDRLRATRRLVVVGAIFGMLSAGALGFLGFDGRVGFAMVMAGTAVGAVGAALWTIVFAIVDEARRAPVALARVLISLGLFAGGAALLVMVAALAGLND
ncbi:MAG: hypothetical protein EA388_07395 [Nitriliruptor sp.]|nr:MAG: hypothetical protein EA388_07395 [Nitriliruptor sp.]